VAQSGTGTVQVAFEVAQDSEFSAIALSGVAQTDESKDYTLKVRLNSGIQPNTTYYYRFIYQGTASRTGRFKTLPDLSAQLDKIRFGYINFDTPSA